jgi:hypothetical protein
MIGAQIIKQRPTLSPRCQALNPLLKTDRANTPDDGGRELPPESQFDLVNVYKSAETGIDARGTGDSLSSTRPSALARCESAGQNC